MAERGIAPEWALEGHNASAQFSNPAHYFRRPQRRNTEAETKPLAWITGWSWDAIGKYLVQITLVFLAYLVAGKLGQATADIRSSNLGPVWPAYGIALAALLLYGYRVWPGIAASAFLVALLSPVPPLAAAGQAAGATIAALTGAFLLRQIPYFDPSLPRLRDALGLIVFGAFGSAALSASIGVSALYANHVQAYYGLGPAWLIYWLGDSTGVLLVTPLVFALPGLLRIRSRSRIVEFAVLLMLLTAACFIVFGDLPFLSVKLHVLAFSVLPFVIWSAIAFGVSGAAVSTFLVASIATIETALGSGPFAANSPLINAVLLDVFFGVLAVSGLILAAVTTEGKNAERAREYLVREQAARDARNAERKQGEEALRQKGEELSEAQRLAGVGSWYWDVQNDIAIWSEELYRIAGRDPMLLAPNYKECSGLLTAESWERLQRAAEETLRDGRPYELNLEMVRPDGTTRWVTARAQAVSDTTGRIVGLRGTTQDITERKLAEEALAGISRKLVEAQEQERSRIARELHDDISQQLALLSGEIQQMKEGLPVSAGDLRSRMDELEQRTSEISTGVQSLSHELHSSRLEYLGVVSAIRGFCREFGDKHKVKVAFDSEGIPPTVPQDISLCLFRVMQEALHNAVKHSGVGLFEVKLHGSPTEIRLTVRDSGSGFEPELIKGTQGLGLISMQERVRLVKGTISITSKPQSGTEVSVRVPLSVGTAAEQTKSAGA